MTEMRYDLLNKLIQEIEDCTDLSHVILNADLYYNWLNDEEALAKLDKKAEDRNVEIILGNWVKDWELNGDNLWMTYEEYCMADEESPSATFEGFVYDK